MDGVKGTCERCPICRNSTGKTTRNQCKKSSLFTPSSGPLPRRPPPSHRQPRQYGTAPELQQPVIPQRLRQCLTPPGLFICFASGRFLLLHGHREHRTLLGRDWLATQPRFLWRRALRAPRPGRLVGLLISDFRQGAGHGQVAGAGEGRAGRPVKNPLVGPASSADGSGTETNRMAGFGRTSIAPSGRAGPPCGGAISCTGFSPFRPQNFGK